MRLVVANRTRGEIIPIISMIITIEIREEEEEDKDLEEEASVENVFILKKKGIENLRVPSAKEGLKARPFFVHVDEDAKSSHSKDSKIRKFLVNRRVLLSGENEPD